MSDIKEISPNTLALFGIIGGLIGIYLSPYAPAAGSIGAICAVIWGAEAVRRVAKYGLGTGVPSIGQIALGMGIIAAMFGLAIVKDKILAGPIVSLITASVIGLIIGWFAQNVIKMKIPVMIRCMTEIAASGALIIIGYSASVAGNYEFNNIVNLVFDNGVILAVFWVGAVAMLHPFNACLGPDEKQQRLLYLAGSTGAITMALMGIAALMTLGLGGAITLVLGIILWLVFYKKFWDEVYKDAASVVGTGLIPKTEA
ncbi:MAG: tetrahydromethanopterin S-methyltransferase subunit C [Candidatus Methanoperedens sp.]|nr:tetrahydromethanopterin S-methyltransferase subunit C [Candidatus Methanoperedens sp.]MCE8428022.1 tetrahydromethanopterin S-methyltransferase subunit C [Candidatus Methanoperedens sp.]